MKKLIFLLTMLFILMGCTLDEKPQISKNSTDDNKGFIKMDQINFDALPEKPVIDYVDNEGNIYFDDIYLDTITNQQALSRPTAPRWICYQHCVITGYAYPKCCGDPIPQYSCHTDCTWLY